MVGSVRGWAIRVLVSGLVNCIYTQPNRVKELAVEGLLFLIDSNAMRQKVYRMARWERIMVGELIGISPHPHPHTHALNLHTATLRIHASYTCFLKII